MGLAPADARSQAARLSAPPHAKHTPPLAISQAFPAQQKAMTAVFHDNRTTSDATKAAHFPIVQPSWHATDKMKALVFRGGDMKLEVTTMARPVVTEPGDVIVRVTATTVCGSDMHLAHNEVQHVEDGDVLGHEAVGIIVEAGPAVTKFKGARRDVACAARRVRSNADVLPTLRSPPPSRPLTRSPPRTVGDRVVVSPVIACGDCAYCRRGEYSCCDCTNPDPTGAMEKLYGHRLAGVFGYSHLLGGYPGCQAEFVRVPIADVNVYRVPDSVSDELAVCMSDILCTAWHANELGEVKEGDKVVVWGCGAYCESESESADGQTGRRACPHSPAPTPPPQAPSAC